MENKNSLIDKDFKDKLSIYKYSDSFYESFFEARVGISTYQLHIFIICGLFAACDAFAIGNIYFLSLIITDKFNISIDDKGWINLLFFIGIVVSCSSTGFLTDKFTRKQIIVASVISLIIFTFLASKASDLKSFTILTFLIGVSIGPLHTLHVNTVGEFYGISFRWLVVINVWTFYTATDIFYVILIYTFIGEINVKYWESYFLILEIPYILILIYCLIKLSDSPRFLIIKNKENEAIEILKNIEKSRLSKQTINKISNYIISNKTSQEEKDEIIINQIKQKTGKTYTNENLDDLDFDISYAELFREEIISEVKNSNKIENSSYLELFNNEIYLKCLILLTSLISIYLINLLGYQSVFQLILKELDNENSTNQNANSNSILIDMIIFRLIQLPANPVCGYLGDKENLSRVKLATLFSLVALIFCFLSIIHKELIQVYSGVMFFSLCIALNTFYGIIPEIFPTYLRDKAMSFTNFVARLSTSISMVLLSYFLVLGINVVLIFLMLSIVFSLVLMKKFPYDTRNLGLDVI